AMRLCRIAPRHDVGRYVAQHDRAAGRKCMGADAAKLMDERAAAKNDVIADQHMTGELAGVRKNYVVADFAIVSDMGVGHDPVVVPDLGYSLSLRGADVDRAVLANGVVIADLQTAGLTVVLLVLWDFAQAGERINVIVATDAGAPGQNDVRTHGGARADLDMLADHTVGADADAIRYARTGVHDRCRMDRRRLT